MKDAKYRAVISEFISGYMDGKEPLMIDVMTKTITFVKR